MTDMGKVILLTGAPGTGKSTLRRSLGTIISNLQHFDYGDLLLRRKELQGISINYDQLREQSASVVEPLDVATLDDWVISEMNRLRQDSNVLVDSHALTREAYGFRAIPYSTPQLAALRLDAVITLRCDPDILIARVAKAPGGRRPLTLELAREIQILQQALGLQYCVACACPFFVIDTTALDPPGVAGAVVPILDSVGVTT